jgi:metallophosphoesterase superfamily enzyme
MARVVEGVPAVPSREARAGDVMLPIAGRRVTLLPERAALLHADEGAGAAGGATNAGGGASGGTLLIADVHLGKGETLRAGGAPVGRALLEGLIDEPMLRLRAAAARRRASRVLVLGDLLHAPAGLTDDMLARAAEHFAELARAGVRVALVPGNHDRRVDRVSERWGVEVLGATVMEGPWRFTHEPCDDEAPPAARRSAARDPARDAERDGWFTWCGHLHPAVTLRRGGDALKLACFAVSPRQGLLPAFSRFTAGVSLPRVAGTRLFAVADEQAVVPV